MVRRRRALPTKTTLRREETAEPSKGIRTDAGAYMASQRTWPPEYSRILPDDGAESHDRLR